MVRSCLMLSFRTIGTAAMWSVGNAFAGQIISMLAFLITARIISPSAFGVVAVATVTIEVIKRIATEPVAIRLTAMNAPDPREYEAAYSSIIVLSAFGMVLATAIAYPLGVLLHLPELPFVLCFLSATLFLTGLGRTHEVRLIKRYEFRLLAARTSVAATIGGITGVLSALFGLGVWSLVLQQLTTAASAYVLLSILSDWRPTFCLTVRQSGRALSEARYYILTNVTTFVGGQADVFFVTSYLGPHVGGIYSAAKRLILAASLIALNSLQNLIVAAFAAKSRDPRAYQIHIDTLEAFALVITPLFIGLSILSHALVDVLLGAKWAASAGILALLAIGSLGGGLAAVSANFLMTAAADRSRTAVTVGVAVATLATLPLAVRHGPLVVAATMAVISWLSFGAFGSVAALRSKQSVLRPFRAIMLPLAGALTMLAGGQFLQRGYSSMTQLLIGAPALLFCYSLAIVLLGLIFEPRVRRLLKKTLQRA